MTADDPGPPLARSPTGDASLAALERPDGGWQVGVGPGAVVLRTSPGGTVPGASSWETGQALGPALAGLAAPDPAPGGTDHASPACAVLGTGPLASRLRRALGDVPEEAAVSPLVVVHQHVVPPDVAVAVARSGRVTLPVVVQRHRVLVGPVVGLGTGPCLHCLDRHRRDRDRAWPALATALGHPAEQGRPVPVPAPLVSAAEGLVLLLASSVLAGATVSAGLCYELGPGAPHVVVRRWTRHPGCAWHP